MKIIPNPKSKKRKFIFLITSLAVGVISTISLVACSSIDYNPKELDKGAAVYSKTTEVDKKPYVQINLYGYEDFTFGNWYPTYTNSNSSTLKYRELIIRNSSDNKATVDPEFPETGDKLITIGEETEEQKDIRKRWGLFAPKYKWVYNHSPIYNSLSDKQKDSDYLVDALEQKQEPDSQKFISLIKTDEELKSSLRLDDESKNLYLKYLESITEKSTLENVTDKNAFLEKNFLPWSNTFNYDAIKSKLDLKKYDYIFIKDLARYFHTEGNGSEYFLDGGLEISNYEVDKNSKEISISWDYKPTAPKDKNLAAPDIILTGVSKRSHSFLLPVEKGSISDFKVDDWSFKKIS